MVVKIQNSCKTMAGVLDYNERKVSEGTASVIGLHGIYSPDEQSIRDVFAVYERRNIRTENVSFHMSINPGPTDNMTDNDIVAFADKMMNGLGYAEQPYVIYRHDDIDRIHYHVVSIRVNDKGKKIRDRQEHRRCQDLMEKLQKEFSFVIGNPPDRIIDIDTEPAVPVFDREADDVSGQICQAFDDSMQYHFTTWQQFQHIMMAHRVKVDLAGADDSPKMTLQGVDQDGRSCTTLFTEEVLNNPFYEQFSIRVSQCLANKELRKEKNRICNAIRICTAKAVDEQHLKKLLSVRGIDLVLSRGRDGRVFGITLIDHKTKSAFKGSELGREIGALVRKCLDPQPGVQSLPSGISDPLLPPIEIQPQYSNENTTTGLSDAFLYAAAILLSPERGNRQGAGKDPKKKRKKKRL